MKKTYLEQVLVFKSLDFVLGTDGKATDHILSQPGNDDLKNQFKNVCAPLPSSLVERLESTLGLLNISKRQFITAAIIEALDKADVIMKEWGVDEYLEELIPPPHTVEDVKKVEKGSF